MGMDKCVLTCIYHYDTIQSIFTALKIPCALSSHLHPLNFPSLENTDPLTVIIVLPFPEYHIVETVQDVVFSHWLLLFMHLNMHLNPLYVFSWFDSSFVFLALNATPLSVCTTCWRTYGCFQVLAIMNNMVETSLHRCCVDMFSTPLGKYQGAQL